MPSVKSAIAPSKSTLACFPAARVVQASASQFAFNARRTEPYVEPSSAAILRRLMPCACSSATLPRCQIFRGAPWDKFLPLLDNRVLPALAAAACSRRARATPNRTRSAARMRTDCPKLMSSSKSCVPTKLLGAVSIGCWQRQRVHLPTFEFLAGERNPLRDALAVFHQARAEVDPPHVLHQDVQRARALQRDFQRALRLAPVQRAQRARAFHHDGEIAHLLDFQLRLRRLLRSRAIQHEAIILVEFFKLQRTLGF